MPLTVASPARRPWAALVLIGAMTGLNAWMLFPPFAERHPWLAAVHGVAAATGAASVLGLWRRARWLPAAVLPWGVASAALAAARDVARADGNRLWYLSAAASVVLWLWVARVAAAVVRPATAARERAGA
jgi:hypothetical protein